MAADCEPLSDEEVVAWASLSSELTPPIGARMAVELLARRTAMKHADDLGIDVDKVARLICPPVCETCNDSGRVHYEWGGKAGTSDSCPTCHGRPKWTLHDRLDTLRAALDNNLALRDDSPYTIDAILADVAEVTP